MNKFNILLALLCIIVWGCAIATIPAKEKTKDEIGFLESVAMKRESYLNEYIDVKCELQHRDKVGSIYTAYNKDWQLDVPFFLLPENEWEDKILYVKNKKTYIKRYWLEEIVYGCGFNRAKIIIENFKTNKSIDHRRFTLLLLSWEMFERFAWKQKRVDKILNEPKKDAL